MSIANRKLVLGFSLLLLGLVVGCSGSNPPASPSGAKPGQSGAAPTQSGQSVHETASKGADAEIEKNLAELSPEDQAIARKQKVCPISGEALGGMGKPYKVVVKGRTVFLCCSGCEEELQKNADKVLAKLDAAK